MHAIHALVILLCVVVGVALLFMMTAGWFTRRRGPDDTDSDADRARADRARRRPPPPPVCPVSAEQRDWIERSMAWCAREFGEEAARRPVVLPTAEFLPASYDASNYQIHRLYNRIASLMDVDVGSLELRLRDRLNQGAPSEQGERRVLGRYHTPPYLHVRVRFLDAKLWLGRAFIEVERAQTADPVRLVAVLAHELAHRRLLGEGHITADRPDHERLTELLTVYLGFGIFTANMQQGSASQVGHVGYLTVAERGYALACYCRMRAEFTTPNWASHLHPQPGAILQQALSFLAFETGP